MDSNRPKFTTEVIEELQNPAAQEPAQPSISIPHEIPQKRPRIKLDIKKLYFLIPAILLVITIVLVTIFIRGSMSVSVSTPEVSPMPSLVPQTPRPTPEPRPSVYGNLLFSFEFPPDFTLVECEGVVYLVDEEKVEVGSEFCLDPESPSLSVEYKNTSFSLPTSEEVENENLVEVSGTDALRQTTSDQILISFAGDEVFYLVTSKMANRALLDTVLFTFNFKFDPTLGWETFDNTTTGYSLKYPPEWTLIAPANKEGEISPKVEIRKSADNHQLHNLVVDASEESANPELTAIQIAASTRTLSGWSGRPALEYRTIGGGTAQVVSGLFNGGWSTFIVLWHKQTLIQMSFSDITGKLEQETLNNILSTFEFTR